MIVESFSKGENRPQDCRRLELHRKSSAIQRRRVWHLESIALNVEKEKSLLDSAGFWN
jgi:hypothetical protein